MARNPHLWGEFVREELREPTIGLSEPAHLFAFRAVQRWLKDWRWQDLVAQVRPDRQWFDFFVSRNLSPRWPPARGVPEVDASVIVVGEALWDLVAPLTETSRKHRLVRAPWQDPETLVVVRIVQGLTQGWRGFDAFPASKPQPAEGANLLFQEAQGA